MTSSQPTSAPDLAPGESVEDAVCERHGPFVRRVMQIMPGANPIRTMCPACQAEDRERRATAEREAKLRAAERALQQRIGRICIPPRFAGKTFADYRSDNEAQARVLRVCTRFAEIADSGESLILCGKPGTGKTHLACAIARRFAERGKTGLFLTVLAALRHVKSTYRRDSELSESDAIADLVEPDLLILDEIGMQVGSEHEKMLVFDVINERYQQCRSTILISNLDQAELSEFLGDRLIDRFHESGGVLAFDWSSHRRRA